MVRSFFDPNMIKQMMPKQGLSSTPAFDIKQVMETNRKNAQAVTDVLQMGMACLQEAMSRQAELISQMVQDNSNFASSMMAEGTPEQKIKQQTALMRKSYEATVEGVREVSDILTKSGEEATELLSKRVAASLNEFGVAFEATAEDAADATSRALKVANKTAKKASEAA